MFFEEQALHETEFYSHNFNFGTILLKSPNLQIGRCRQKTKNPSLDKLQNIESTEAEGYIL